MSDSGSYSSTRRAPPLSGAERQRLSPHARSKLLPPLRPSSDAIDEMRADLRELRDGQRELRALVLQMLEVSQARRTPPEQDTVTTAVVRSDEWFADVERRAAEAEAEVERLRHANGRQAERRASERLVVPPLGGEPRASERLVPHSEGAAVCPVEPPPPVAEVSSPPNPVAEVSSPPKELGPLTPVQTQTLVQARRLAHVGVGETQKAHGFTLIAGPEEQLMEKDAKGIPVIGEINDPQMYDYHDRGFSIFDDDFKHLQTAVKEDGAVVIGDHTGSLVGANYMVCDIRCGDNAGGARHRSASAAAQLTETGCFVVKASEDACGPLKDERGHIVHDTNAKLDVFLPGQKLPIKVPVHDSAKVLGVELINAARNGDADAVRDLIKQGVNVNYQDMVRGAARKRREPLRERPPRPPTRALAERRDPAVDVRGVRTRRDRAHIARRGRRPQSAHEPRQDPAVRGNRQRLHGHRAHAARQGRGQAHRRKERPDTDRRRGQRDPNPAQGRVPHELAVGTPRQIGPTGGVPRNRGGRDRSDRLEDAGGHGALPRVTYFVCVSGKCATSRHWHCPRRNFWLCSGEKMHPQSSGLSQGCAG